MQNMQVSPIYQSIYLSISIRLTYPTMPEGNRVFYFINFFLLFLLEIEDRNKTNKIILIFLHSIFQERNILSFFEIWANSFF